MEPKTQRIRWAELQYDGVELTALRSTTENAGRGLTVGTETVKPEPTVASLAIIALESTLARRRRSA
ncbi:MAG: hypothetical protein L7V86_14295 [Verrucomicrobiales bacterium]|nr:hypothetical protein [Verrucomicrobiales bacterium]